MASEVNIAEYATVPQISGAAAVTTGLVQFPGELIRARDVAVDGSASYELQAHTRYVIIHNFGSGTIYAASASSAGTLEQGHGRPATMGMAIPISTRQANRWLRLLERVED